MTQASTNQGEVMSGVDWTNDREAVIAARPTAYSGVGDGNIFTMEQADGGMSGLPFWLGEDWHEARQHTTVVAYEALHNPAKRVGEVELLEDAKSGMDRLCFCGHARGNHWHRVTGVEECGNCGCLKFIESEELLDPGMLPEPRELTPEESMELQNELPAPTPPESKGMPERPAIVVTEEDRQKASKLSWDSTHFMAASYFAADRLLSASREEVAGLKAERDRSTPHRNKEFGTGRISDKRLAEMCQEVKWWKTDDDEIYRVVHELAAMREAGEKVREQALRDAATVSDFYRDNCSVGEEAVDLAISHTANDISTAILALLPPQPRPDEEVSNG